MKLFIVGLLIIGQVLAAPERRLRRDAPILPSWDVPYTGFDGRSIEVGYHAGEDSFRGEEVLHDEYGVPHEEYGPPQVPHEEYGPPEPARALPETTTHYCPEEDIVPPFAPAPAAPGVFPLPEVPILRKEPVPVVHEEYGPPAVPHEEYGPPEVPHEEYGPPEIPEVIPFVPAPPAPEILPLPEVPIVPIVVPEIPHEEYGPPEVPHEEYGPPVPEVVQPYVPAPPAPEVYPLPEVPSPPPVPIFYAPYPAPTTTTTTEVPTTTTTLAPYPPPTVAPLRVAPYPPPTVAPLRVVPTLPPPTLPPVKLAPYPAPVVTEPPVVVVPETTTTTTAAPLRSAPYPYPAKTISHYGSDSSASSGGSEVISGGSGVIVPAVRAPVAPVVAHVKYIKPRIVISKKVIGFPALPNLLLKKRSILKKIFHH